MHGPATSGLKVPLATAPSSKSIEFFAVSTRTGKYLLVVPGAVGRPKAYDNVEFERSAETLAMYGGLFQKHKVKAAIEPIRSAEVSLVHTVADAKRYLGASIIPA